MTFDVLAGFKRLFSIASGSGTIVTTDILSEWNNGNPIKAHDTIILQ